jgi:hypothetical protein
MSQIFNLHFSILNLKSLGGGANRQASGEGTLLFSVCCAVMLFAAGCSPPSDVDRDNRRVLDAILTAITMKNASWLEQDAALVERRHQAGQLSDWEHDQLLSIVETARGGDWKTAEEAGYEFRTRHPFVREGE